MGSTTPPAGALGARQLRAFYGLDDAAIGRPTEQRIYVVDSFDDHLADDLRTYRQQYGLPGCEVATGCLQILEADGSQTTSASYATTDDVHGNKVAEVVSAICPPCGITAIRDNNDPPGTTTSGQVAGLVTARWLRAAHVNASWEDLAVSVETEGKMGAFLFGREGTKSRGIVYTSATGNTGFRPSTDSAPWPAASPAVLAVGGVASVDGQTFAANAWSSGCSTQDVPPYQVGVSDDVCKGRASADLSGLALNIAVVANGAEGAGWQKVSGTSAAAPAIAGLAALAGSPKYGTAPGYVYDNAAAALAQKSPTLFDVTTGTNWNGWPCGSRLCTTAPGWDGPTGWGVPSTPAVLQPASANRTAAKAVMLNLSGSTADKGCLAVLDSDLPSTGAKVRNVSCESTGNDTNWQALPVAVYDSSRKKVRATRFVLEDAKAQRAGCLSAPVSPPSGDTDVFLGDCGNAASVWLLRSSGKLQNRAWRDYYLFTRGSLQDSGVVQIGTGNADRVRMTPVG